MTMLLKIVAGAGAAELTLALLLTLLPKLPGSPGRILRELCTRAPGLDVVIALLTWVPWVVGAILTGWSGFAAVLAAPGAHAPAVDGRGHAIAFR